MTLPLPWLVRITLVIALSVTGIQRARADDRDEQATEVAKKHFYRAEKLFALRRFERALDEYEAAFEAKPIADFLFNIGQCHVNLGNYREAIFSFRKYLKLKPDARNRKQVEEYIADLEEKADREPEKPPVELVPKDGKTELPPPRSRPFYKKWWFWTGVATVAAGTTAAVLLYDRGPDLPLTDLGNLDFPK